MISASTCTPSSTACGSPKSRSNMTKDPQNLVIVGTGADPGFNATTAHQQNPNYRPFMKHL
jgi:hypothetical protein